MATMRSSERLARHTASPEMAFFMRELKVGDHDSEELRSAHFDKLERKLGSKKTVQRDKTLWLAFLRIQKYYYFEEPPLVFLGILAPGPWWKQLFGT